MVEDRLLDKTITAISQSHVLTVEGMASVGIQLSGTFTGTLVFEGTIDGTNWASLLVSVAGATSTATGATATGVWTGSVAGLKAIRVRSTAWTSGTANISLRAAVAGGGSGSGGGSLEGEYNATPPTLTDGQTTPLQVNDSGQLLVELGSGLNTDDEVSTQPNDYAVDDSAMPATPQITPIGGEYRATPTTYTDGDATVKQTDVQGRDRVAVPGVVPINGSFTRPNDTTAYAAGDVASDSTSAPTVITFTNAARANGLSGTIIGATLVDSANQATKGVFELWVFDTTVTPDNDNAVFTPTDGELATLVGVIPFDASYVGDATSGAGGNAIYQANILNLPFAAGASSRNLFGVLVVRNAYTPVAQEVFTVRLNIIQN